MILRIWRTHVDTARMSEYEAFEQTHSLPMFRKQTGFLGVAFLRGSGECAALTLWSDSQAVADLGRSESYLQIVGRLEATGLLTGMSSVETFEVKGGYLAFGALRAMLQAAEEEPAAPVSERCR